MLLHTLFTTVSHVKYFFFVYVQLTRPSHIKSLRAFNNRIKRQRELKTLTWVSARLVERRSCAFNYRKLCWPCNETNQKQARSKPQFPVDISANVLMVLYSNIRSSRLFAATWVSLLICVVSVEKAFLFNLHNLSKLGESNFMVRLESCDLHKSE